MDIGFSAIIVSLLTAIISFATFLYNSRRKQEESIYRISKITLLVHALFLTIATATLLWYFLIRDFNVEYVASYSDRSLGLWYTISALWAGQSGSLLLWSWILSLFAVGIIIKDKDDKVTRNALTIILSVNIFLLILLTTINDPFKRLLITPLDGNGLNPLLQNEGMIIHPPTLFIGYAGLTIPFAYAISGLISESETWIFRVRKWLLFSWLFLGLGIWLGGWWSYSVLGWGGYWAWDPVENASLIPWLVGSALLHSINVQQTRQGMKLWNILLSIGTFATVFFASFVTRSGLISSVHAFGESVIGTVFSVYLGVMIILSLAVLVIKFGQVRTLNNVYKSALGKETSYLLNILLFVIMSLIVIWGTIFPLLNQIITHTKVSIGPGFYNTISPFIMLSLVLLMGFCIILRWGTTSSSEILAKLKYPVILTALGIIVLYYIGFRDLYSLVGFGASILSVLIHFEEYLFDAKDYARVKKIKVINSVFRVFVARRRRYGGYIVHISMILILIGIVGTSFYKTTYSTVLEKDKPVEISGYSFTFKELLISETDIKSEYIIKLSVTQGSFQNVLTAKMTYTSKSESTLIHVGVMSLPTLDIYVIPESINSDQYINVTINYYPLIGFIWLGGPVMLIGTIITLLPKKASEQNN